MNEQELLNEITGREYGEGFTTPIAQEFIPKGLTEDTVRLISSKKGEPGWLLEIGRAHV